MVSPPALDQRSPDLDASLTTEPDLLNHLAAVLLVGEGHPIEPKTFQEAMDLLFAGLPPRPRAWSLCETYLEHSSMNAQITTRQGLIEHVLTPVYNAKKEREDSACEKPGIQISPQKLAFLYLVFAQGVLVDLTLPAYHVDGEKYHLYGCAAMALYSFIDKPTVETVEIILLMVYYRSFAGDRYSRDSVWALGSVACKLAQSVSTANLPLSSFVLAYGIATRLVYVSIFGLFVIFSS